MWRFVYGKFATPSVNNLLKLNQPNTSQNQCSKPRSSSNFSSSSSQLMNGDRYSALAGRNLRFGPHIKQALANGDPIVALESTVITHGMPEPDNLKLALKLEQIVRAEGSVPATIGIVNGQLVIGLNEDELEFLSNRRQSKPMKASRRDIPVAIALKRSAGTTVAGTMSIVCSLARSSSSSGPIKVFATGGTGGVHKGAERSMDISADLFEFSRSPIGVVSSGFKSFLDTRKSLEYLETLGCTVMSLKCGSLTLDDATQAHLSGQQSQLFPAFYCAENQENIASPLSVGSIQDAASILFECLEGRIASGKSNGESNWTGDCRGALIAVPIPKQYSFQDGRKLDEALAEASKLIDSRQDLHGYEKTPLILAKLNELTGGKSLEANLRLLENNARVGALLAKEYESISRVNFDRGPVASKFPPDSQPEQDQQVGPLVIGCTMVDMHVSTKMDQNFRTNEPFSGVTFEGRPHLTVGGVGRNLAVALEFLGCSPRFLTALADDSLGQFAQDNLTQIGLASDPMRLTRIQPGGQQDKPISCFALVLRDSLTGQCEYVIANLDAVSAIGRQQIEAQRANIAQVPLVVLDSNLSQEAIETTIEVCHQLSKPIFVEPTDCLAIPRLATCIKQLNEDPDKANWMESIFCLSPNLVEFQMLYKQLMGETISSNAIENKVDLIDELGQRLMREHLNKLKCLLITMDKDGVLAISRLPFDSPAKQLLSTNITSDGQLYSRHFKITEPIEKLVSGSGAGDSFAAGFIASLIGSKRDVFKLQDCIQFGFKSARLALMDEDTIPKSLMSLRKQ